MLCLLENLYQTIYKSSQPKKPFEECRKHHGAHDRNINNLYIISNFLADLTSLAYILHRPWLGNGRDSVLVRHFAVYLF